MKKIYNSFLTTFGLICRLPVPLKYNYDFSLFPFFFPIVGLFVSALGLGLFFLFNPLFLLSGITSFLILLFQYFIFNLFHFDGLLDCADAFLFNTSKERRLTILTDKRTGSFAIFSGVFYMLIKFYLLSESISIINSSNYDSLWIIILLFYPLSGRIAGSLMPSLIPPAEDPGLAELLKDYSLTALIVGIMLSFLIPLLLIINLSNTYDILISVLPFTGAIAAGILISFISKKLVGGYTGDSIGLTIEIGELFHLLIAAELLRRIL